MSRHIEMEKLALYAGDDLPEKEKEALVIHIAECPQCRVLLDEFKRMRDIAGSAAAEKTPQLPEDFTERVMTDIGNRQSKKRPGGFLRFKSAWIRFAAAVVILAGVFWAGRFSQRFPDKSDSDGIGKTEVSTPSTVTVDGRFLRMLPVVGPCPIDEPLPVTTAGVYLILYRPKPDDAPDIYTVDYIGEYTGSDSDDITREIAHLSDRAVSRDNIFIVLYPMPLSSIDQRQRVAKVLIQTYKPQYNEI